MGLEPEFFVNKIMDFQKKKLFVNEFMENITTINEVSKKQMVIVQISYENFAYKHQ